MQESHKLEQEVENKVSDEGFRKGFVASPIDTFIPGLPDEIGIEILRCLDLPDLLRCTMISHKGKELVTSGLIQAQWLIENLPRSYLWSYLSASPKNPTVGDYLATAFCYPQHYLTNVKKDILRFQQNAENNLAGYVEFSDLSSQEVHSLAESFCDPSTTIRNATNFSSLSFKKVLEYVLLLKCCLRIDEIATAFLVQKELVGEGEFIFTPENTRCLKPSFIPKLIKLDYKNISFIFNNKQFEHLTKSFTEQQILSIADYNRHISPTNQMTEPERWALARSANYLSNILDDSNILNRLSPDGTLILALQVLKNFLGSVKFLIDQDTLPLREYIWKYDTFLSYYFENKPFFFDKLSGDLLFTHFDEIFKTNYWECLFAHAALIKLFNEDQLLAMCRKLASSFLRVIRHDAFWLYFNDNPRKFFLKLTDNVIYELISDSRSAITLEADDFFSEERLIFNSLVYLALVNQRLLISKLTVKQLYLLLLSHEPTAVAILENITLAEKLRQLTHEEIETIQRHHRYSQNGPIIRKHLNLLKEISSHSTPLNNRLENANSNLSSVEVVSIPQQAESLVVSQSKVSTELKTYNNSYSSWAANGAIASVKLHDNRRHKRQFSHPKDRSTHVAKDKTEGNQNVLSSLPKIVVTIGLLLALVIGLGLLVSGYGTIIGVGWCTAVIGSLNFFGISSFMTAFILTGIGASLTISSGCGFWSRGELIDVFTKKLSWLLPGDRSEQQKSSHESNDQTRVSITCSKDISSNSHSERLYYPSPLKNSKYDSKALRLATVDSKEAHQSTSPR